MKKFIHQLFAILMVLVMLFDAAPVAVLAEGEDTQLGAEVSASAESGNATGEANPVSRGGQLGVEKANYYLLDASEYTVTSVTGSFDRFLDPNYVPGNASQAEDTRGLSEGEDSAASADDQQTQALAPSAGITPKLSKRSTPVLQTKDALGSVQTLNTKGVEAEPANDLSLTSVSDGESSAAPESPSATVEEPKASDTNAPAVPEPQQVKGLVAYEIELNEGVPFAKEYDYKVKVPVGVNMLKDVKEEPGKIIKINQVNYRLFHLHGETEEEITNVSVTQNDGIISNFTFTTEDFSTFVLVYTVDFVYIEKKTEISIDLGNFQANSNELGQLLYKNSKGLEELAVSDILDFAQDYLQDENVCGEVYTVSLQNGTALSDFDQNFFANSAVSIEGKGIEYDSGKITLLESFDEAKITFASEAGTLELTLENYTAPEKPVIPDDDDGFSYRFYGVGEAANIADILQANEIVSSYYNNVSVSDEKLVTVKDDALAVADYFDEVILTVSLSDGTEVEITLTNPAPVKVGETVTTDGVGFFAAKDEIPAGTQLVVNPNPEVPEEIIFTEDAGKGEPKRGAEETDAEIESDPVFFDISLVGPDDKEIQVGASVTIATDIKLPEEDGKITKVTGVKVYHIGEKGDAEELEGATFALAEGRISSVSFTTPGFSLFAITYTVEYIEINYNGVINLDFTGFEPYPKEGVDATFIYDTDNCDIRVSVESVLNAALNADATGDGVVSEKAEIENFEIDWTKVETVSAEGGVALEEGVLVISGDGSIVLSDGEKTLTINITGITKLSEEILKADGVEIKVEEGKVPLGSQAQYTQNTEEKTASLVEEHKLGEGEENIAGYSSADLKIVRNGEPVNAEGQFSVALEKSSLIPKGMKLDKLYHIHDGEVEELTVAENDNGQLEFTLSDFSDIVASYTVDFEYNGIQFSMPGGGVLLLSELFEQLHIDEDVADVEDVTFTDYSLLKVEYAESDVEIKVRKPVTEEITMDDVLTLENDSILSVAAEYDTRVIPAGEWIFTSLQPFDTYHRLTIVTKGGIVYEIDVTDAYNGSNNTVRLQDVVTDGSGDTTKAISVKLTEGGSISDMSRTASLKLRVSYVLTAANLQAMQAHAAVAGNDIPTIFYDFSSALTSSALADAIQTDTITLTDEGKNVGTVTIGANGVVTIQFTDKDWFAERTQLGGYFDLDLQVDTTEIKEGEDDHWLFPGAPEIGPIHYKDVLSNGGKAFSAQKLQDENGKDYYLIDYTASIYVNSDVTNVTFEDTLMTDGVAGGIQDLVWGSAKLDGESVDVNSVTPKNGDWKQGFNLSIPSLTTGQHTVTYQVKIPAEVIEGMTEGERKDAVNKAEWKLTGDKTIPGGETHYVIEKPYRDVEVHKTAPETADPDGYVHYTITFGDSQTPLKNLVIMDSITDIQQLQGQIAIKVPGRADVNIDGSVNCTDANYSTGMTQLFWYKFGEDDTGYGPVTVEYTTKMINATTARQNGIFDAVNAINTAYEERTYKSDSTTTTVEFPHAPNITVEKTATVSPEDVDADGNWKPDATVQYTVTIGEAGEDLSYIRFSDQMSNLLTLTGDISVSVNGSTDSEVALAFKSALETSRNSATTGTLFDFTAPAGTTAPIVITYTTHLSSVAEAKAAQIYGDQHVSNHISVGNEHDDEGSDVHYPNEYELTKSETHDAKGTDGTQTIHWTVEYGDGVNNDMDGARIYDEMTKAQKLVAGSVKVTLSTDLSETITWPDGTVWTAGSTGPFDMPEATAKTATDGVIWTKFYSTDTNYSLSEMVPVFNLKLPDGFGTQKVTVAYDTVVISDREAMAANITGTQNVYNRATVGHSSDMETVEHDFPTITEHKPKVEKAFSRFDFENRLVYWTIAVSADIANGSGYPLTNVAVVEPTKNSSIQYHIDNVKVYNTDGTVVANNTVDVHTEDFDLSKISVVTENGVTLEPGVDYTIDYSNTSWIGNGAPTIHFPELNEKIYITIAYSTGNNDIINGFSGNNKINVFSDGGNDDATAVTSYTSSDIDVTKIGQTDPKNRIIKWKVTINPQKLACAQEDTIWFDDDIPSGHILVDYNAANSVFKTSGSFDASTATASPSINVYCSEYDNWVVKSLDATEYANQSIHANIIRSDPTNSSILWRLSGKTYEVEYYTWVDDTKWAEITSGLSGSEKVTNTATIHVGDVLIGEGTGSTTVSVEDVITKTDTTTVYTNNGTEYVSTSTTELEPTSTLTYKIDINPNREQLTEAGKKLSVTDTLNTKMELQTDSIVLYYYPIDSEGNEGARTIATSAIAGFEDLTISYNDDTRTMSIGGIPDMMHCELEYSTTARALGTQSYSNTATLIGGGSHSHTITETHTVQHGSGGVTSRMTSLKLKKFDENDVTHAIQGAQFELYECTLAGGVLSDWTTTRTNPDPAVSGDTTEITVLDTAKISAAISAGPGNADYEKLLQDFKIVSWTKSGETKTTNENGLVTFQPVYEDKVYYWKETATASGYDTAEIGVPHYFVLYPEKYANNTDGHTIGDVYPDEERARRRAEAKALDDACSLANGLTIACMVSDNGTTWNVNNIENGYTSISATKEWQGDSDNFFKTRPTEGILLDLYKVYPDGTKELVADKSPMPLNADNEGNWPIVTWSKLPKTETLPSGQVVNLKYTVVERPVTNYTTEYSDDNEGVTSGQLTVTNTLIPVNTRISVKKVFDQGVASMPDQIVVKLWQICTDKNGAVTRSFYDDDVLSASNNWQYTWKALPTRDDKGNTFTYTVTEDTDALLADGFHFTAIYSDEGEGVTSADTDDPLIIRNIENGLRIVKTLGGDGSLLTDAMKQQIRLTVEKVGGTSDEKVTFTLADMTVGEDGKLEKILSVSDYGWIDDGSLNVTEINPNFKHFGVKSVSYTINGGTTSVVTDDLGRVVMQNVTLQDGASGLLEITNEYEEEKTELPVQKLWQDVSGETIAWPADVESVTVDLMKVVDGEEVATGESLTLDSSRTSGLFANLPKYEFNTDRLIEYTVRESVKGYTTTVTDEAIDEKPGKRITNRKDQPKLFVEKVWDGATSFIPSSIKVQLYESATEISVSEPGWTTVGTPVTITAADNWQAAFEDLTEGKYYKVEEVGTVSGWTLHSYSDENGSAFHDLETITITNKRTPPPPSDEDITVGVQKAWTEDGKPLDAPVDDVKVKLVRYKTEAPAGVTVKLFYDDYSNLIETDISREVADNATVSWSSSDTITYKVYGYDITGKYLWQVDQGEAAKAQGSTTNSLTVNLNDAVWEGIDTISVLLKAGNGHSSAAEWNAINATITGGTPRSAANAVWSGPVDVDYSAIDTSVGSEYDRTNLLLTLSADNSWQYEFENLPKKGTESGVKYLYRYAVVEETVPGFTTSYTYDENGERISLSGGTATALGVDGVVKVTNNRETTKITAKKKWSTNVWPQDVTQVGVKLTAMANGSDITSTLGITAAVNGHAAETAIAKPASGNEASVTWSRLPKLDNSGNEIIYTIEETSVTVSEDSTPTTYSATSTPKLSDLFEVAVTQPNASGNATITNTPIVGKITVTKYAKVDDDPDTGASGKTVWVGLFSDSNATTQLARQEITITDSGSGVAEFNDLKPGTYYVYELTGENGAAVKSGEVSVDGTVYTVSYENAGDTALAVSKTTRERQATVTNSRSGKGSVQVTKAFSGIASLPSDFKITATWKEGGVDHTEELTLATNGMTGTGKTSDPYTWTIDNLPLDTVVTFTESGYDVAGYSVTITGSANAATATATAATAPGEAFFVNTYTELVNVDVTKSWGNGQQPPEGAEIKVSIRPVTPSVTNDAGPIPAVFATDPLVKKEVTLNGGQTGGDDTTENKWKYTWSGLPKYDDSGNAVEYKITEAQYKIGNDIVTLVGDMQPEITGEGIGVESVLITNKIPTTDVKAKKNWPSGQAVPEGTTVKLAIRASVASGGTPTGVSVSPTEVTLDGNVDTTETTAWEYTWSNLPQYDKAGKKITYTVTETEYKIGNVDYDELIANADATPTSGYDFSFTNQLPTTDRHAVKEWQGTTGSSATFTLSAVDSDEAEVDLSTYAGIVGSLQQTVSASTTPTAWKADWTNLPMYTTAGKLITYSVAETPVEGYRASEPVWDEATKTWTITNTELTTAQVTKQWTGATSETDNKIGSITYRIRRTVAGHPDTSYTPADVTVTYAEAVTNGHGWGYTWSDLPTYGAGTYDDNGTSTVATGVLAYNVEEVSFVYDGVTYNVTKSGSAYTVAADTTSVGEGETVGTWQTTASGNTFTNELLGSVRVTKSFSGVDALPDNFQITASWGTAPDHQSIVLKVSNDGYTGSLPAGITVTKSGAGTTADPYEWTISKLPIGTVVTFVEENYTVAGYNVTATLAPTTGQATAAVTPGTVAITNEYVAGVELPATGGTGTLPYTLTGLTLLLGAALFLFLRRKREQN